MNPSQILGGKMTPSAKITSSVVSLIILAFLFASRWIPQIPEKVIFGCFGWLGFHIINHLSVAIYEIEEGGSNGKNTRKK